MDQDRFDDVVKSLAAGADRRSVLKRIAGGALGGLLGLAGVGSADAAHKKGHHCTPSGKHKCRKGYACVDKKCVKSPPPPPPPPKCGYENAYCSKDKPCCDGYYCKDGYCKKRTTSPPPPPAPVCPKGSDACSGTPTCGVGCSCATTVEGKTACRQTLSDCSNPKPCNHSKDCKGGLCVKVDNCCPPPKGYAGICSTKCVA